MAELTGSNTRLSLLFEYPCNEQVRSYLRIENLFEQLNKHINDDNTDSHLLAIQNIFILIDFMYRNDLKTSVLKNLDSRLTEYVSLERNPDVDKGKLQNFLEQLRQLQQWIYKHQGKFGQYVMESEFWSSMKRRFEGRQQLLLFENPQLVHFLNLEPATRRGMLAKVLEEFYCIKTSINVLLNLLREESSFFDVDTKNGNYQQVIQQNCQLVRLKLRESDRVYPEISVGNHRFSIRFHSITEDGRMPIYTGAVAFRLSLC